MQWFTDLAAWYGALPGVARMGLTILVGAMFAVIAFRVIMRFVEGLAARIIAAILAFLLTTVPGNLLLQHAAEHVGKTANISVSM